MEIPTIAVVGGINMDLVLKIPVAPGPGDSLDCDSLAYLPGGKGANMAVAAYRAAHLRPTPSDTLPITPSPRLRVCMNSAVGKDGFGQILLDGLRKNGVETSTVHISDTEPSGTCVVIVEPTESRNLGYLGANRTWSFGESDKLQSLIANHGEQTNAKSLPDLVLVHPSGAIETMKNVLSAAHSRGVDTLLNASTIDHEFDDRFWSSVTHLILNKIEAARLLRLDIGVLSNKQGLRTAAQIFIDKGVEYAIITLGADGAYYATRDGSHGHIAAEKDVAVVDTTGAGDTFVSNYAVEYMEQKWQGSPFDIELAIQHACHAAARTIERLGAQEAIPWRDQRVSCS